MMPYQRRSGAIQCWPVKVISGVIEMATNKQISPAVPSTSASVLVSTSLAFSESQPRRMKSSGMNAGRRSRSSASDRFRMVPAEKVSSSASQESVARVLTGRRPVSVAVLAIYGSLLR